MKPSQNTHLIAWPCYEPAGHIVEFDEADLVQHLLLIGSTGCGKSSLLIDAVQQLVVANRSSTRDKVGLLILDAKADDLVARVQSAVRDAGRSDDLLLFGPGGSCGLDLFGGLHGLDDIDRVTSQVMLGAERFGGDNAYWWHSSKAMVSAAFALLIVAEQEITFESTVEFLRLWFLSPVTPSIVLEIVGELNERGGPQHPLLATAMQQVDLWQGLDPRTRSNLQSCLLNVLRPLLSPAAVRFLGSRGNIGCTPAQAATDGKICIVSINSMKEPDFGRFIFRLAKQQFFDAVQQPNGFHRLCGLVADELPLIATPEDVEQLATVRSKRCFVLAATQGLHVLAERIGVRGMHALVNNFNTVVYMRSREAETSVHAFMGLGTRKEIVRRKPKDEGGGLDLFVPPDIAAASEVPVCPMGTLGRLAPHQAFLTYPDGRRTESPLWFVPWFERALIPQNVPVLVRPAKNSAAHVIQLMVQEGFRARWDPHVILQAATINKTGRQRILKRVNEFFLHQCCHVPEGLEKLPHCWLAALPGILWSLRKPHWTKLPFFISRISVVEGLLIMEFAQELPENSDRITAWDRIRIAVNAGIYPNRWRPLLKRHCYELCVQIPDLRTSLNDFNL